MGRATVVLVMLGLCALAACRPATQFEAQCEPSCFSDGDLRRYTSDLLVRAPGAWRFFDDYASTVAPACPGDGGAADELELAWSHAVLTIERVDASSFASRTNLDARGGVVALSVGRQLWTWEAVSGLPLRALTRTRVGDLHTDRPVVALTKDGQRAWVNTVNEGPVLLDFTTPNQLDGPAVLSSAKALGYWAAPAQAVDDDDTLYWTAGDYRARALGADGRERWANGVVFGRPYLGLEGKVLFDAAPINEGLRLTAFRTSDGAIDGWTQASGSDWTQARVLTPENARLGTSVVTSGSVNGDVRVRLHGSSGMLRGEIGTFVDGGIDFLPDSAALGEYELYLVGQRDQRDTSTRIAAFDAVSLRPRWFLDVRRMATPPVSDSFGRLFVATEDCQLLEVTPGGVVSGSTQLRGKVKHTLMKLAEGMVFVLTEVPAALPEEGLYPGKAPLRLPDGGVSKFEDYECGDQSGPSCIDWYWPDRTRLYVLYAFKVPLTAP